MTPPPPGQKTMEAGGVAHAIWTGGQHNGLQAIPGVPKWGAKIFQIILSWVDMMF